MSILTTVNKLTAPQRALLIEHVPARVPVDYTISPDGSARRSTTKALLSAGLIRHAGYARNMRPQFTILTELGREVVCCLLGQYADALVLAGLIEQTMTVSLPAAATKAAVEELTEA